MKTITREELIEILTDRSYQDFNEGQLDLSEILRYGWKGFEDRTNQELEDAHNEGMDEKDQVKIQEAQVYTVTCKYCGHTQKFTLDELANPDIENLCDALTYDQEYTCNACGCQVRVNEALPEEVLKAEGWL